jgi:4'-phosphopantetheinyl transferase EntD
MRRNAKEVEAAVQHVPGALEFATLSEALAWLLPPPVFYKYAHVFVAEAAFTPEEAAYMARLRPQRRLEFATGRHCAQSALAALGRGSAALGRESDGRPRWPPGIVGSISHCEGACVAAAAEERAVALLGVDVEPRAPLPEGVLSLVASPEEIAALPYHASSMSCPAPLDTVLFSAKESVFKALYPGLQRFFAFDDVSLVVSGQGRFEVRLQPQLAREAGRDDLVGRFALTRDYVLTAICAPLTGFDPRRECASR